MQATPTLDYIDHLYRSFIEKRYHRECGRTFDWKGWKMTIHWVIIISILSLKEVIVA